MKLFYFAFIFNLWTFSRRGAESVTLGDLISALQRASRGCLNMGRSSARALFFKSLYPLGQFL